MEQKLDLKPNIFSQLQDYVFDLSDNFKLKPHALLKYATDAPISYDLNA